MAIVTVNLQDSFANWRTKTNNIGSNAGDLTTLTTTHKSTLVGSINELLSNSMVSVVDDTSPQLGGDLDLNGNDITGTGNINITGSLTATSIAGSITGVTQAANDNSTKLATTEYADTALATYTTKAFAISMAIAL